MNDLKDKKTPALLTRADIKQIAAEADARMGRVARKVRSVLMVIAAALVIVTAATLYLGLIVIASVLVAVCLVTFTLYLFVRLWPGASPSATGPSPAPAPTAEAAPAAVLDGLPRESRFRVLWALRAIARRQDDFRISGRAAERFARTIRFVMKTENRR